MRERRASLRARLLGVLMGAAALIWLGVAVATFLDAREGATRLFDEQLSEYSEVLSSIAAHEVYEIAGETTSLKSEYAYALAYQVWSTEGELLLVSHAAPRTVLAKADGFSDVSAQPGRWRVFRRIDPDNGFIIIVAQDAAIRDTLVRNLAVRLLFPALLGLPLLGLAIWFGVSRALAPLDRLANDVRGRQPQQLNAVALGDAPTEVRPLVDALNQLFARVEASFDKERRFTGDAAHELRTPLAALRTQAEVALTTASEERRRRALEQVIAGVDRAARLVEELLALARLDAPGTRAREAVDLAAVARDVADEAQAARPGRAVSVIAPADGHAVVAGDAATLHALVRNLVVNALQHAPERGQVRIGIARVDAHVRLSVEDNGPGVAPELRERIFDRFFRVGASGAGSGLGLSIVRRIVELHEGRVAAGASEELGGLRVDAIFPASDKDSLRSAS